jgi:RND family efflux transporter MFP subunit
MIEAMPQKLWRPIPLIAFLVLAPTLTHADDLETFTEPYRRVAIPAPEIGVISEILVEEGDEISNKQVLARLDDSVLRASLQVAQAAKDAVGAIRTAETELTMREKQLESYRELHERGNATQRELDRAESEYQQAASRLQSVREDLEVRRLEYERVKAQLQQRIMESPLDGFVIAIEKEAGEFVSPTDPVVMHVVHLATLKAVFSVPLDAARGLQSGATVELRVGYEAARCKGVLESVSPVADAESGTVRVRVRIPNREGKIQSGVVCRWNLEFETPVEKTSRTKSPIRSVR